MIVFVPAYDEQTKANLQIAEEFQLESGIALLGEEANRKELLENIKQNDNIFIMSHGAQEAVYCDKDMKALSSEDAKVLNNKKFFVFACHTATNLGKIMIENGNEWWGYTGQISAPDTDAEVKEIIVPIFQFILENYYTTNDLGASTFNDILKRIKELCDDAALQLDKLDDFGYMDTRLCIEHLWNRLRIWSNPEEPLKHPDAPPPYLLD